jgi:hypothetical protein
MPDQPSPPDPDDLFPGVDDREQLLAAKAHLLLDSIEKEEPEDERYDDDERKAFTFGYRCGFQIALDAGAYGAVSQGLLFDPEEWTADEVADMLDSYALAWLARMQRHEVEQVLRRILREEEGDDD